MNSSVGRRSGLVGAYISSDQMKSILSNGSSDVTKQQLAGKINEEYPDHPQSPSGKPYDFFILFPNNGQTNFKEFITVPINHQ